MWLSAAIVTRSFSYATVRIGERQAPHPFVRIDGWRKNKKSRSLTMHHICHGAILATQLHVIETAEFNRIAEETFS